MAYVTTIKNEWARLWIMDDGATEQGAYFHMQCFVVEIPVYNYQKGRLGKQRQEKENKSPSFPRNFWICMNVTT